MNAISARPVRALLILIALAVLLVVNDCDAGCELPDLRGPDGWRSTSGGVR
jgi:hypothetical protein